MPLANAFSGEANIIFYYAGHGIPDETTKTAYLLPKDGDVRNLKSAYKLDDLYKVLGDSRFKSVTVFLDACFSGIRPSENDKGDGYLASRDAGIAVEVDGGTPLGNTVVFSAARGNEFAYPYPDKEHGLFTYFLLKKLQETKGDVALGDLGKYITTQVLQTCIKIKVPSQTPTINPSYNLKEEIWKNMKLK
jgi:uncharacterized caspase-like protein